MATDGNNMATDGSNVANVRFGSFPSFELHEQTYLDVVYG